MVEARVMRDLVTGVVLPAALWAVCIWSRLSWDSDIEPAQWEWVLWIGSLSVSSVLLGFGVRAYWWPGNRRHHRDRQRKEDR